MIIDSPIISGSYAATGSLNQVGNVVITGSLTVTEQITGSINSASFAQNAATASYLSNYIPPFPYTGSAGISGSLSVNGDITSSGAIVAQTLYVQTITSSVDFVTGSTRFGSELSNTHLFTGSVTITGSLAVNGSTAVLTNQTGAMSVATASYVANAVSASFSQTAISASYASNVPATASFAVSASQAENATSASYITGSNVIGTVASATSASFAQTAISASYASNVPATASFAVSASQAESASYALTASFASNVPATSSFAVSASQAQNAVSAAYSAFALTSSYSLAGSGFPFSGSAVITGSLLITNLSSSGVSYLVADSTGFITAQTASAAIKTTQTFTASSGQTTFAITNGYATGLVDVFVNGTKLNSSEFTDTNGTTIVLATGSFVDDIVEFSKYLPASGVTNNTLRQLTTFTASAGQTVFSASYTPGLLDIYYNGSHLSNGDFTANNGTFITLATGSAEGDILDVFVYTYQVGAFSGIGGQGVANEISYFNTTNSITSSAAITISGTNAIITGSLLGTASYAANANLLDGLDSSVFVPTGSFNTFSSSLLTYTGSADSRFSALETTSGSNITRIAALEVTSGSNITRITSLEGASGSAITRLSALEITSGSNITRLGALETASGSAITRLSSIESTTGSLNAASGSAITRLSSLESKTGSYATTGSNTFVEGQYLSSSYNPTGFSTTASLYTDGGLRVTRDAYISGTLYLNNVTVFGTQSVCFITSSQLNISSNLISVNTATPSVRFGGLAVYDSGSTGLTGSLLWDSQNNHWIYSNPSGSSYSGGMFISGPRTSTLGSETGTTACAMMIGQGGDHITSSAIFHYGNATCFYGNSLVVSGSGNVGIGVVPSAWADYKVLQLGGGSISSYVDNTYFEVSQNAFWNSSYKYVNNGFASRYQQYSGGHEWYIAPSGTANCAITFTQAMTLNASGNLVLGNTSVTNSAGYTRIFNVYDSTSAAIGISIASNDYQLGVESDGGFRVRYNGSSRLTIASTGISTFACQVGIGVVTPQSNLHVLGTIKVATGNAQGILGLGEANGTTVNVGIWRGAANAPTTDGNFLNLGGYDGIVLATGASAIGSQTERIRLTSGGQLLLNTTSARGTGYQTGQAGQIAAEFTNYGGGQWFTNVTNDEGTYFVLGKSRGVGVNCNTVVQNGDTLGAFIFQGTDGTGAINAAMIRAKIDGTPGTNDMPGRLEFYTTSDGSTTLTERLRISANGTACFACELTAKTLGTNDLILNNLNYECANYVDGTRGSWLIQEGACDLFIINQVSCKKYKFNLIEIK